MPQSRADRPAFRGAAAACVLLALASCGSGPPPATQPGQMLLPDDSRGSVIGSVTGFVGGAPEAWETLDFSVGAPDATASIQGDDGRFVLIVMAYPPGTDGARAGRITIEATLPNGPVPGPATGPVITLHETEAPDGPGYRSTETALLNVSTLSRRDGLYGEIAGSFVATLCRTESADAALDPTDCRDVAGEFETDLQLLYPEFQ